MLVKKNYYLYEENDEKQQEKKKLLGSVRLTRNEEQWAMEIQWKNENEAEKLVSEAEEGELQLRIKVKEIILRCKKRDLREDAADTNADKTEEQELAVAATENKRKEDKQEEDKQEEDKQEREEQQRKLQIRTGGEDRGHQIDQEWELVRRSCHRVESCKELGEVYRINKGEFAVIPDAIKHILQNSFLVHGLMNYGYLLLFRADEKLKQLGVGVPGVYYEKEKLVAEMFGFPQFWCDGKSNNGKFGYYLRIVS